MAPTVLGRTTFCYPDSVPEPTDVGTAAHMPLVALALADERAGRCDALDDYVEAHVHGPLLLGRDVEALVLDPCYRGTAVEEAAASLPFAVEWHHGFRLRAAELGDHVAYRGPRAVTAGHEVAYRLGDDGWLDARVTDLARSVKFYEAALAAGATTLRPPGVWPEYHEGYYGAFVADPDGISVEAVCHGPDEEDGPV